MEGVERWLEARKLRNRLVDEYMERAKTFAEDLELAKEYSSLQRDSYNLLREFAITRMAIDKSLLPKKLSAVN